MCLCTKQSDVFAYMGNFLSFTHSLHALDSHSSEKKVNEEEEKWMPKWLVGNSWVDWHMLMKYSQFIWRHKKGSILSVFFLLEMEKSKSEISK